MNLPVGADSDEGVLRCLDALMGLKSRLSPGPDASPEADREFLQQWGDALLTHATICVHMLVGNGAVGALPKEQMLELSETMMARAKRAMIGAAGDRGAEAMKQLQSWLN
jgi:hypothetical protein